MDVVLRVLTAIVFVACASLVGACGYLPQNGATTCTTRVSSVSALRAAAGTTGARDVCMAGGNYTVDSYIRVASNVRLHGYGVTLRYTGPRATLGFFNADGTHDIVVDGFVLDGGNEIATGFRSQNGAHHIVVRGLTVKNMAEGGVNFQKSDHVVAQGNTISHVGYTIGWGSAIDLWFGGEGTNSTYDGAAGFHAIIAGNVVSDVADGSTYQTDGNGIIIDGGGNLYPVLITGNVIHDVRGRGVTSIWNSADVWVVNNTVARASNAGDCDYASYSVQGFNGSMHWINNISQPGCGPNYAQYNGSSGYSWRSDIDSNTANRNLNPGSAVQVANPLLDANTFAPLAGSPALGTGIAARTLMSDALRQTGSAYMPSHNNVGAR